MEAYYLEIEYNDKCKCTIQVRPDRKNPLTWIGPTEVSEDQFWKLMRLHDDVILKTMSLGVYLNEKEWKDWLLCNGPMVKK